MLQGNEVAEARKRLGLSQAIVAREAGIHRTVLSNFETGQLVLGEGLERQLREAFQAHGELLADLPEPPDEVTADDEAPIADAAEDDDEQASHRLPPQHRMVDGKVIPSSIDPDRVEALAAELVRIQRRIFELQRKKCDGGMLGRNSATKRDRRCFEELKLLIARAYFLTEALLGRESIEPMSKDEWKAAPDTMGSWLGRALGRLFEGEDDARGEDDSNGGDGSRLAGGLFV